MSGNINRDVNPDPRGSALKLVSELESGSVFKKRIWIRIQELILMQIRIPDPQPWIK